MSKKEDSGGKKCSHQTELYAEVPATCLPIVYSPEYNITFMGLEKLHPFDAGKWGKVIRFLKGARHHCRWSLPDRHSDQCVRSKRMLASQLLLQEEQFITDEIIVLAREASEADLLVVHTARYLNRLKWSLVVATITEIPPVLFLPNFLVQRKVLKPLRTQTGGTIMVGFKYPFYPEMYMWILKHAQYREFMNSY
ncbi:Histone deacetylase 11 [Labeo rohita]|uniref:Histone deacetylase 11 n=1 Tax=Labeo rohita TaxID=84645 RepID=A0ABQ8M952_LABRO|nr:Histone deacetylase 11 [Labeo rohita]